MNRWKSHGLLAAGTAAAFFGAQALSTSAPSLTGREAAAALNGKPVATKPAPEDPAAAVTWAQTASLADCEALLAGTKVEDLAPLLREALFLRLAELAPGRLIDLLLAAPSQRIPGWGTWIQWLALAHPDLLQARMAGMSLSRLLKETLERSIRTAENEKRNDPRKILEAALEKGRHPEVGSAFLKLAASDPHLALDYMELLMKDGRMPRFIDGGFMAKMAEADPARFQALMVKVRDPESQMGMAAVLARTLGSSDPAAAVALYASLPASRSRSMVAVELTAAWSKRDPEAALAWVQASVPEGAVRRLALAIALTPFATSDPKRVLALLGPGNDGNEDRVYLNSYSTETSGSSFGEGTAAGRTDPNSIRERALLTLVESSPGEAFAILDQELAMIEGSPRRFGSDMTKLVLKAAGVWLKSDPAGAIGWLSSQDGATREVLLSRLQGYLDLPPEQARVGLAALGRFEDVNDARHFMRAMVPSLAKADPAAAFDVAGMLPENLRADWVEAVIGQMTRTDPAAAAKEVGRLPEKAWPAANASIARQMAAHSPQEAIVFLDTLPPEAKNATVYRDIFQPWIESQPQKALEWWEQLPPGDSQARRGALTRLAGRLYEEDPSTAPQIVGMIVTMQSETLRMQAVANLAESIAKTAPDSALELIANPELKLSDSNLEILKQNIERSRQKP